MPSGIRFILNDREVETDAPAGLLVLDFLRECKRLTGTKEGCKEGDCGACAILIGELKGDAVRYQPVTSCLVPLAEVHGRHVVTIEGCNQAGLNPVQEAIVEFGGTQCGFCTPGIVVSLHGLLLDNAKGLSLDDVKYALGGHLCRCTGYRSLKDCAAALERDLGGRLQANGSASRVPALTAAGALPEYFNGIPRRLRALLPSSHATRPEAGTAASSRPGPAAAAAPADPTSGSPAVAGLRRVASGDGLADGDGSRPPAPELLIAGGTDLYVQQGETIPERTVVVLGQRPDLKGIRRAGGEFRVGALTTFEEFGTHPAVIAAIPRIGAFNHLIASWQIRNRATLAGNIVNASPIGDFTALLLALDATHRAGGRRCAAVRSPQGVLSRLQADRPASRGAAHRGGVRRSGRCPGQLREGFQAHLPRHRLGQQRLLDPLHRGYDRRRPLQPRRRRPHPALPARDLAGRCVAAPSTWIRRGRRYTSRSRRSRRSRTYAGRPSTSACWRGSC